MKELDNWDSEVEQEEISDVQEEVLTFISTKERWENKQGSPKFSQFMFELKHLRRQKLSDVDQNLLQRHLKLICQMITLNSLVPENQTNNKSQVCAEAARKCLKERKKVNNTTIH